MNRSRKPLKKLLLGQITLKKNGKMEKSEDLKLFNKKKYSLLQRIKKEHMTGADLSREAKTASVEELLELGEHTMSWFRANPNTSSEIAEGTMFVVIKELAMRDIEPPWREVQDMWKSLKNTFKDL